MYLVLVLQQQQKVDIYYGYTLVDTHLGAGREDSVSLQIASGMLCSATCVEERLTSFHYLNLPLRPVTFILPALGIRLGLSH